MPTVNAELSGTLLRYNLDCRPFYVVGTPVTIKFTLENIAGQSLFILTWYTPLEGVKGKIFRVTCGEREAVYIGPMFKRGDPEANDYVRIDKGASLSAEIDLSQVYEIALAGKYKVEFKGRIHDVVGIGVPVPRRRDEHRPIDIQGNIATFELK